MPARTGNTAASKKRAQLRTQLWPQETPWLAVKERGWFTAPRSLPLVMKLLESKKLKAGKTRLGPVYLELLSRHIDEGLVEMATPEEHAYASGFTSTRAQRDWRDHMAVLKRLGLIHSSPRGNMTYGYVIIVHPTVALQRLQQQKKLDKEWYSQYQSRQTELKEPAYEELRKAGRDSSAA